MTGTTDIDSVWALLKQQNAVKPRDRVDPSRAAGHLATAVHSLTLAGPVVQATARTSEPLQALVGRLAAKQTAARRQALQGLEVRGTTDVCRVGFGHRPIELVVFHSRRSAFSPAGVCERTDAQWQLSS